MKKKYPKVHVASEHDRSERYYEGNTYWYVTDLWAHAKQYEAFEIPLMAIDISCSRQLANSIYDLARQITRCRNASLEYPILLTPDGAICDGVHRVAKAISNGQTTIMAKRFVTMPQSYIDNDE